MQEIHLNAFQVKFTDSVEEQMTRSYGEEHWERIKRALPLPPKYTAARYRAQDDREEVIRQVQAAIEPFNELLEASGRDRVQVHAHPVLKDVIVIPSCYPRTDIVLPDRAAKNVILDRLCGEAVLKGSDVFAPGVMCSSPGLQENEKVNVYIDLEHNTTRGYPIEGHQGSIVFIGFGQTHMARTKLFRSSKGLAVSMVERVCADAPPMNRVLHGTLYMQNLPCSVVAHVLDPKAEDVVLDMCAAPGGKTTHIAALMRDQGTIVSCDRSRRKIEKLKDLLRDSGYSCVCACRLDSTQSVLTKSEQARSLALLEGRGTRDRSSLSVQQMLNLVADGTIPTLNGFFPRSFDRILLDPPCSALGLRPRLAHGFTSTDLERFCDLQRRLIWAAVLLLKPGGTLVYSTCTINPNENERMVEHILATYPSMQLVAPKDELCMAQSGLPDHGLDAQQQKMVLRFDPSAKLDTMGFFCAKFVKTTEEEGPGRKQP